ncbi:zinc finger protein 433 [Manduca sexta]|uniref:zinc finger protein 433 n=1 Tax=Manduca sexta TaxID=7130 RepID=UPI00189011B5|nr:zinc finger protein 433 [Manduca sexta]
MTSIILARKLTSVKVSKEEFEKIKLLKAVTTEKSLKIIKYLKKIIEAQNTNKTCRLCLKPGTTSIFNNDKDYDMVKSIKHILGVEVSENDGKPQHICSDCESTLRDADRLRQTAEATQWRLQQELEMVANTSLGLDEEKSSYNAHGGHFVEKEGKIARRWSCGKCLRRFDVQSEFIEHENQSSCCQLKFYICETCGMEFKTLARLKRHGLVHNGSLVYACAECPYRARTPYALVVHARTHSGARPLCCSCGASFPSASSLASHRRTHRPPAYHCPHCEKSFRFKQSLRNHIASQHSTAKPHVCNTCGKAFATRKLICRHERRVHNRPKMRSGTLPTYLKQQEELRS